VTAVDQWPVNPADLAVFAVLLISALLAFARGLIKELLSVVSWVGAAVATLYGLPYLEPFALMFISVELIAKAATGIAIFVVTLVILSLISQMITARIKDSMLSAIDRSLGFVFGVFRGSVLLCLAFLVFAWAWPPEEHPQALRTAKTRPVIEAGADLLRRLLPSGVRPPSAATVPLERRSGQPGEDSERAVEALIDPRPGREERAANPAARSGESGYKDRERKDLDRLIQGTQ
jgi:membrane protein required for colicin V production